MGRRGVFLLGAYNKFLVEMNRNIKNHIFIAYMNIYIYI